MHVFLTGDIQVGKSTIIRRYLEEHPGLRVGGFLTVWGGDRRAPDVTLHIIPADGTGAPGADNVIKRRTGKGMADYPEVYDAAGVRLLQNSAACDIIVMDEIGPGENEALAFHRAVLETLRGDVPVLGVVRALPGVLTDAVRACGNVRTVTVTEENREDILQELLREWRIGDET